MFKIIYLKTTQYLLHWAISFILLSRNIAQNPEHTSRRGEILGFYFLEMLVSLWTWGKIYCIRTEDIKPANKQLCIVANFARSAYRNHAKYFFLQTTSLKETHGAALFLNWLCWKIQIKRSKDHGLLLHPIILGSCTRLNKNDTDWIF